jgi:uncharacterized repeat protein (TIGR03803 family)
VKHACSLFNLAMGAACVVAMAAAPDMGAQAQGIKLESSFTKNKGAIPFAALTPSGGQLFYGTTISNAANNYGGVYTFTSSTGAINLIDTFTSTNGSVPFAVLTPAGGGVYYGTTYSGGAQDLGGVFAFNSSTGAITLKDSFTGTNGASPYSALTPAGGNLFYGTTYEGGADDLGGVFAFDSSTGLISLQASFTGSNGANPLAGLTAGPGGVFYGTTGHGGASGLGAVFAFNSATGEISLQDSFNGANGDTPHAPLTAAGGDLYYGTTIFGGSDGFGTVYSFNRATGSITLKDSFTQSNGATPYAALTPAEGGLFYGTTYAGGADNLGTVYAFNSLTGAISLKDSFRGSNGARPLAALTAGEGGLYYGTTTLGGVENLGAIYSFNPVPGPLPLMGVGAALGWSKRLRRRLRACPGGAELAKNAGEEQGQRARKGGGEP